MKKPDISITTYEKGFTVWVTEKVGKIKIRHWVMDGSIIQDDLTVRLGIKDLYPTEARYNDKKNEIKISKKKA